ncbi:MAG: GH3 auxin-responsive promoter family protein [Thermonemataceae bacterium]|nr:GH3 auxin-responsive promoter family protein [Thermonemataceae bacterium]
MGIRSFLAKPLASYAVARQEKWAKSPAFAQEKVFKNLIQKGLHTIFGKDHHFSDIKTHEDFIKNVPIRDYEGLKPYIEQVVAGKEDILWQGKPLYFAKTSGTTSGVKYIPISQDSIHNHINGAKNALLNYVYETGNSDFLDRKLIFLSGSPILENKNGVLTGRLSGISNHHVPGYLRSNQLPSWDTNCIEDWEDKLDKIIEETLSQDMSLISGIPPWVQMYFDRIITKTGKKIKDIFPNFSLFIYGGVNFEPYKSKLWDSIGKKISSLEMFPASEGFFAYQDKFHSEAEGLLLLLDTGIFYEFVPTEEYFNDNPKRLSISEVELNKNYALVLSNNAGLWAYSIGDTVKFVSKNPYRVIVSGRIKHFISAFGEHVIGEEVEKALKYTLEQFPETEIIEMTVAPQVTPQEGLPYHEWLISFAKKPHSLENFAKILDQKMTELNVYYDDLIRGAILRPLVITPLAENAFIEYMKSLGKLGGQNKVPRLSNDRKIAEALHQWKI